ncbi:hypothetical protein ZIOFF_004953 [Zingiber officinale]|uniref:Uncharacterized protein n=2 Tax=Zingiber officinale TaxID=94328 RepID=A0A8J5LRD0_ZINOF|nr:hypothetical protein ZIOFF_004953 [Zingiber officinale]
MLISDAVHYEMSSWKPKNFCLPNSPLRFLLPELSSLGLGWLTHRKTKQHTTTHCIKALYYSQMKHTDLIQQRMANKTRLLLTSLLLLFLFLLGKKSTASELSSEESRRLLWAVTGKKYISYEALRRDVVPCTKPGVPYYNCHTLPSAANHYRRGCQIISGCRSDSP